MPPFLVPVDCPSNIKVRFCRMKEFPFGKCCLQKITKTSSSFTTAVRNWFFQAGPIADQSKLSDLDCGRGDPGSNLSEGLCFLGGW